MDDDENRNLQHYDVVIVGGGMVGGMLAAALGQTRLNIAVLEAAQPKPFVATDPYDLRVSALSIASESMLGVVDAWKGITERRCAPFRFMQVWDGEQGGSTRFDSAEAGHQHLGHIVENRVLQLALYEAIEQLPNVDVLCPARLVKADFETDVVTLTLDNESNGNVQLSTRLLIGADGARSKVRELAGIAVSSSQYPQQALVASVTTAMAQQDITWQRFLTTGPQALLPLQGSRASMVWYHTAEEIARLKALPDTDFMRCMEQEFPAELGKLVSLQGRASFPLGHSHADQYVDERVALIGDAAHTVHPLAGQGVNLGLLDAAVLAQVIADTAEAGNDIGLKRNLRQYERWRRPENGVMIKVLDSFYHAFKTQPQPVPQLRSLAMDLVQKVSPMRRTLMQLAMGTQGDLPRLALGQPLLGRPLSDKS